MIDLHIHTTYSDGADSLIQVLEKAQKLKLEYISITDHETCKAYPELEKINREKYYRGTIIPGIEMKCGYHGRLIEILGYKVDTNKMNEWTDNFYKNKTKAILQQKYFDLLYDKCLQMNLKMSPKEKIKFESSKAWASVTIYNEIKQHPENESKVPEDFWESFNGFSKKYCGNPNHVLYIDKTVDYPTLQEAIDAVKQAGGLVFLPHFFIYQWADNIPAMLEDILKNYAIDGIECYHSELTDEQMDYLKQICEERNYYKSGGSDYHGVNKKGIEMAVGKGNLKIKKEIIQDWMNL